MLMYYYIAACPLNQLSSSFLRRARRSVGIDEQEEKKMRRIHVVYIVSLLDLQWSVWDMMWPFVSYSLILSLSAKTNFFLPVSIKSIIITKGQLRWRFVFNFFPNAKISVCLSVTAGNTHWEIKKRKKKRGITDQFSGYYRDPAQ